MWYVLNHRFQNDFPLGIDVGGTFTDVAILNPHTNTLQVLKVSSTPADPSGGIFHGIQEALLHAGAQPPEIGYTI